MAEAVVGVLMGKLGAALANEAATYGASLLFKEASSLKGLFSEIRKAEGEMESIKAYLRESEKLRDADETTGIFVNKIRELSFRIEDVVDEFMYKLEDNKLGGFAAKTKKRIKHVKVWHRLALQLRDINVEIEDATKRRDRYVIPGMERHAGNSDHHARSTNQALCFAREEDLVGIKGNAAKLKGWLVDDLDERNTKITTVWGMGGVGKTTLVDHVYKIVKLDFDAAAWVTVSKSYQVDDLLKKIARQFGISIASNMEMIRVVDSSIRNHLEGKRYILVLDDIWEQDMWINNIMPIFPTNCSGRFVLTSRSSEVASVATRANHSRKLFCNEAFWNSDDKRCPPELLDLAELESYSTNNAIKSVDTILRVSLEDLPSELKNCFLHCAMFPEDYQIKRRRLTRHWITSGFIRKKGNKTLEQVAEGYLNDLVNRNLLQVVRKNEAGRVKSCRIHDVIHHLAIDKAEEECFGKVYKGNGTFSVHGTRRLSIQSINIVPQNQSDATHLRAVYVFESSIDVDLLGTILASSTLLSTLDLQGTQIKMLPNEAFNLFNLRFLGLRNTRIESLPEAVGRLQNLEVLDASCTLLQSLPKDVAKLKKLRYLYAPELLVPRDIRNLTGLHALQSVKASKETLRDVAALTELRTFDVSDVTSEHSINLCTAISNMSHLAHLTVWALNENEVLPMEALRLPETLYRLELRGQLEKTQIPQIFSSWSNLNNLTKLQLMSSKLNEDSFSSLVTLRSLCSLSLYGAYDGR
uniref:NB-ARC domain-containing protein n=1 Tax=Setaria italica TaxID=4555 RepID=K3ZMC2_SETIT